MTLQEAVDNFGKVYQKPVQVDPYNDNGVKKYGRILADYEVSVNPYHAGLIQTPPQAGETAMMNGETVTVLNSFSPDEPLLLVPNVLR